MACGPVPLKGGWARGYVRTLPHLPRLQGGGRPGRKMTSWRRSVFAELADIFNPSPHDAHRAVGWGVQRH